jgi:hypothetical protein
MGFAPSRYPSQKPLQETLAKFSPFAGRASGVEYEVPKVNLVVQNEEKEENLAVIASHLGEKRLWTSEFVQYHSNP